VVGFGDGSGGCHSGDKRLRRVAWALEVFAAGDIDKWKNAGFSTSPDTNMWWGGVAGPRQPINRAELSAFDAFLDYTGGTAIFVTDSAFVVRGHLRIVQNKSLPRAQRDLWAGIRRKIRDRGADVDVIKVESHLDKHPDRAVGVPTWHIMGNARVDAAAEEAATMVQLDLSICADVAAASRQVNGILWHHCRVLQHVMKNFPRPSQPREKRRKQRPTMEQRLAASQHCPVLEGDGMHRCSRCLEVPPKANTAKGKAGFSKWLCTPCAGSRLLRPNGLGEPAAVSIGHQTTHPSHALRFHSAMDLWWCGVCGQWGRHQIRGLARPCQTVTAGGLSNIRRIEQDLAPGDAPWAQAYNRGRVRRRRHTATPTVGGQKASR